MPKGVVHTTGGYMVGAATTFKYVFDHQPSDVFWCTADCGWITGHTYLAYGPLLNCASQARGSAPLSVLNLHTSSGWWLVYSCCACPQVVFEGVPNYPDVGRCWDICDKYKVTAFYTAPTLIRSLMGAGDDFPKQYVRLFWSTVARCQPPVTH